MTRKTFTTGEVAGFCQVTPRTVSQWINEGKITAYQTPGNHSRIKEADLISFLHKYNMPVPEELKKGNSTKHRILVVDDDKPLLMVLKKILEADSDYDIVTAQDGFAAGQKFSEKKTDLIILDIRMPRIDGFQVCSSIRSDNNNKNVKILLMSGLIDENTEKLIKESGADGYLNKPFKQEELLDKVHTLLMP